MRQSNDGRLHKRSILSATKWGTLGGLLLLLLLCGCSVLVPHDTELQATWLPLPTVAPYISGTPSPQTASQTTASRTTAAESAVSQAMVISPVATATIAAMDSPQPILEPSSTPLPMPSSTPLPQLPTVTEEAPAILTPIISPTMMEAATATLVTSTPEIPTAVPPTTVAPTAVTLSPTHTPTREAVKPQPASTSAAPISRTMVEGWVGVIRSAPGNSRYDDYFASQEPKGEYGLTASYSAVEALLQSYRNTGTKVRIWGVLDRGVDDYGGGRISVTLVEPAG